MRALPLALLLLVLAGCSSSQNEEQTGVPSEQVKLFAEEAREAGHLEQAAFLEDGNVSPDDYEAAFGQLRTCIEDHGYKVIGLQLSPVTNTNFDFAYDASGRDQDQALLDYSECEERYWLPISAIYNDTAQQHMESRLLQAVNSCLERLGYDVSDQASTYKELVEETQDEEATSQCILEEAQRLYPNLVSVNIPLGP